MSNKDTLFILQMSNQTGPVMYENITGNQRIYYGNVPDSESRARGGAGRLLFLP